MKRQETREPGRREMDLLQALWRIGRPATVEEVRRDLADHGHHPAYNTVQTMLTRLAAKGLVRREPVGRAHRYEPTVAEDAAASRALDGILGRFFGGDPEALATHLVEHRLGRKELERLRRLVERSRRRGGSR
jgi:predicted transcriptional regulator